MGGDRIALFMSEQGVECVTTHKEEILACINQSVPEVFNTYNNLHNYKMHFYVFQQENCRKGDAIMQCVETSLMKCPDPTPSNLVHGLLKAMKGDALWSCRPGLAYRRIRSPSTRYCSN